MSLQSSSRRIKTYMPDFGVRKTNPEDFQGLVFGPSSLTLHHQGKHLDKWLLALISSLYSKS